MRIYVTFLLFLSISVTLAAFGGWLMYTVYPSVVNLWSSGNPVIWYLSQVLIGTAIIALILFGIIGTRIRYTITFEIPIGDIRVEFSLPWWKKFLRFFMPPDLGEVRAEVRYKYDRTSLWENGSRAQWKQPLSVYEPKTIGSTVRITAPTVKIITIWEIHAEGKLVGINKGKTILPNPFWFNVRLIRNDNDRLLKEYCCRYER